MKFNSPYIKTVVVVLLAVIFVGPWGEHAVNDDWDYYNTTKFYQNGYFERDSRIDATFVLQPLIGMVWANIFGLSFVSLRMLSLTAGILTLFGIYKILSDLKINKDVLFITLLTVSFNTIYFTSMLSYMTEIYFLLFSIFGIYFYTKYLKDIKHPTKYLMVASLLCALSLLLRQYSIVLLVALIITQLFRTWTKNKVSLIEYITPIAFYLLAFLIQLSWPRVPSSIPGTLFLLNDNLEADVRNMLQMSPYLVNYFAFFLASFILGLTKYFKMKEWIIPILGGFILAPLIYKADIFPIGNVIYIEKLYGKSNFDHFLHLFDNIPFKLFLSYYIGFIIVSSITLLKIRVFKKHNKLIINNIKQLSPINIFFFLLVVGMILVVYAGVFIAGDFYDRYFINAFVYLSLFLGIVIADKKNFNIKISFLGLIMMLIVTLLLSKDFYSSERTKWEIGRKFYEERGLETSMFINGTYLRFMYFSQFDTPFEVTEFPSGSINYECFTHSYTLNKKQNTLYKILHRFENSRTLNAYVLNPKIYKSKPTAGVEPLGWHWEDIIFEQTYDSPIYSILDIEPILAVYCNE